MRIRSSALHTCTQGNKSYYPPPAFLNWAATSVMFTISSNLPQVLYFWPKLKSSCHLKPHIFSFPATLFTLDLFPKHAPALLFIIQLPPAECLLSDFFNRKFQLMRLKLRFPSFSYCFLVVCRSSTSCDPSILTNYLQTLDVCLLQTPEVILILRDILVFTTKNRYYTPLTFLSFRAKLNNSLSPITCSHQLTFPQVYPTELTTVSILLILRPLSSLLSTHPYCYFSRLNGSLCHCIPRQIYPT